MEDNQQARLSRRARLLFLTLLAVALAITAGLFMLLAATLPAPVPQAERISALAILAVTWFGMVIVCGLFALAIIRS